MKRITVRLPDDAATALENEAKRLGVSMSQIASEGIQHYLAAEKPRKLGFIGPGNSGYSDTSQRMEELTAADVDRMMADAGLAPREKFRKS